MDQPSLERFQNEIDRFWQKKGIIVDIRNNGGGNIDQELLDILERQPYQFWNNRNGSRTWGRRPRQAIVGPKVMMINYRSVSDAEVTPAGFRQLGLGRIVGNPTSAQVIATGSYALINGGAIRTPGSLVVTWDPSKPNNYGVDLENYGVPPDVWVKNSPADDAKGIDHELKVAIEEAMKMLKAAPKVAMDKEQIGRALPRFHLRRERGRLRHRFHAERIQMSNFKKPTDDELKKKLTPLQYQVTQHEGTERRVPERVLGQPRAGHLRRRRLRRAALQLTRQVRVRHRLAELHEAARAGERHDEDRSQSAAWRAPRCARRTPTRTSATCSTTARVRPACATA